MKRKIAGLLLIAGGDLLGSTNPIPTSWPHWPVIITGIICCFVAGWMGIFTVESRE